MYIHKVHTSGNRPPEEGPTISHTGKIVPFKSTVFFTSTDQTFASTLAIFIEYSVYTRSSPVVLCFQNVTSE